MIKKLLGEPKIKKKCQLGTCYLYEQVDIFCQEETKEFSVLSEKAKKRKDSAMKIVEKKRVELLDRVNAIEITIPVVQFSQLLSDSIEHYNYRKSMRYWEEDEFGPATKKSDKDFLNRITVNYIRHVLTDYEEILDEIYGKVGVGEAYLVLFGKIMHEISKKYPELSNACKNQLAMKNAESMEPCS